MVAPPAAPKKRGKGKPAQSGAGLWEPGSFSGERQNGATGQEQSGKTGVTAPDVGQAGGTPADSLSGVSLLAMGARPVLNQSAQQKIADPKSSGIRRDG